MVSVLVISYAVYIICHILIYWSGMRKIESSTTAWKAVMFPLTPMPHFVLVPNVGYAPTPHALQACASTRLAYLAIFQVRIICATITPQQ